MKPEDLIPAAQTPFDRFAEWFTTATFLEVKICDLTKFTGFILAGMIIGRLLRNPVARWIERMTPDIDRKTSAGIGRAIEKAVSLLIFSVVLKSGAIDVLHLPGWLWEKLQALTMVLMAAASTLLFLQIVEIALLGLRKRWRQGEGDVDATLIGFLRKGIRIFVIVLASLVTLDNIGFKVTGAIAGLGIGGAALALGAQGLIANLLGTIEIVADKLFRTGDRIQFDAFDGFVADIGLRSTKIRALSGELIIFPNRKMAECQIRNLSRNGSVQGSIIVGVTYSTTHDRVREAMGLLESILKGRTDVESHQIHLKSLGAYSVDLEAIFWARHQQGLELYALASQLRLEIKKRFDGAGIEFAYPTQTVHVASSDGPKKISG